MHTTPEQSRNQTLVREWLEHPVANALRRTIDQRIEWLLEERSGVFFPGEPGKTQEAIVDMEARLAELRAVRTWITSEENFQSETFNGKH